MRKICFVVTFCFICLNSFGQNTSETQSGLFTLKYKIRNYESVNLLRLKPTDGDTPKIIIYRSLKFKVVSVSGDTTFIRFYPIGKDSQSTKDLSNYGDAVNETNANRKFYILQQPGETVQYSYQGLSWGALIAPIKIRPGIHYQGQHIPLNLTTNLSIGAYFGYQFGTKYFTNNGTSTISHTIVAFAAPYTSFAEINSSNSSDSTKSSSTAAAFTVGGGYLFNISEKFQLGALVGWDYTSGDTGQKWYYQGKPWFSVAIGFNFTK